MKIELTGNPFVDTGLGVIATLAGLDKIDELTYDHLVKVHGHGQRIAYWNSLFKSTSMIFTINSLITHPSKKQKKKKIEIYSAMTTAFLNNIGNETIHERCEACGNERSLDLDVVARKTLVPLGEKDNFRAVGRDWFPLAGSLGSDAQALPSASRSPNICAKCLFAVHYLPLGTMLLDGRLVVFQSTSQQFWYGLVQSIVNEVQKRISAGVVETLGSKEGSVAAIRRVMAYLHDMRDDLPLGASLFVWKFTNSGTSPDCKIEEVPNSALMFLWKSVRNGLKDELEKMIVKDRNPRYSLLNSISTGHDYSRLYPFRKERGASPKLYYIYQTEVRKISPRSLKTAYNIAKYAEAKLEKKQFTTIQKDIISDKTAQNSVRRLMIQMVEENLLTFDDYVELFQTANSANGVLINWNSWKLIQYYLHHTSDFYSSESQPASDKRRSEVSRIATLILLEYVQKKGLERFRNDVLDQMRHNKITVYWLRRQFLLLAERYEGFTYRDWRKLCMLNDGREFVDELLFQMRLLWTEWICSGTLPDINNAVTLVYADTDEYIKSDNDLSDSVRGLLKLIFEDYIKKRGLEKFAVNVLQELRKNNKGLHWFRRQLSQIDPKFTDDEFWESFLVGVNGDSFRTGRLFQLHLEMANLYRRKSFKQQLQISSK
ncbi:MAG: hypothetical protein QXU32_01050 [Nitrososphaerales archaeon]